MTYRRCSWCFRRVDKNEPEQRVCIVCDRRLEDIRTDVDTGWPYIRLFCPAVLEWNSWTGKMRLDTDYGYFIFGRTYLDGEVLSGRIQVRTKRDRYTINRNLVHRSSLDIGGTGWPGPRVCGAFLRALSEKGDYFSNYIGICRCQLDEWGRCKDPHHVPWWFEGFLELFGVEVDLRTINTPQARGEREPAESKGVDPRERPYY